MPKQPSRRHCRLGMTRVRESLALLYGEQQPLTPEERAHLEHVVKADAKPQQALPLPHPVRR